VGESLAQGRVGGPDPGDVESHSGTLARTPDTPPGVAGRTRVLGRCGTGRLSLDG